MNNYVVQQRNIFVLILLLNLMKGFFFNDFFFLNLPNSNPTDSVIFDRVELYIVDSDGEPIETIPERVFATSESV